MFAHHTLSFAEISLLEPNIAEVVVFEGVEIDMHMVREYHEFLLAHMQIPFAILVNAKNHYTYTFEAQLTIGLLKEIKAVAMLVHDKVGRITMESLKNMPNHTEWNSQTFACFEEAVAWLKVELVQK